MEGPVVAHGAVLSLTKAMRRATEALRLAEREAEIGCRFEAYTLCEVCGTPWVRAVQHDDQIPALMLLGAAERGRVCVDTLGRCYDCKGFVLLGDPADNGQPALILTATLTHQDFAALCEFVNNGGLKAD